MRTVARQKRQDHATSFHTVAALVLLTTLTALPAQFAGAQGAVPCTAIDNDAERLACYDRALRAAPSPAPAPQAAAPAPTRSTPPAAPAAQSTPAAAEPRPERRVRETEARVAPRAPAAPAAGRNADDEDADRVIPIVVVSTRTIPNRETTFTTDDGTRWVQTDNQRLVGLPETPFDAEIKSGAMGSYFLVAKDRPRAVRVRPVR